MASLCNSILRPPTAAKWCRIVKTRPSNNPILLTRPDNPPTTHLSSQIASTTLKAANPPQKYVYPDPIPEFAEAETSKFRAELSKVLSKEKDAFGQDLQRVINVCAEILREFLEEEYGGPGTLLVEPFTDMMVALKEEKLPGAAVASRAALLWAQKNVDKDWVEMYGENSAGTYAVSSKQTCN